MDPNTHTVHRSGRDQVSPKKHQGYKSRTSKLLDQSNVQVAYMTNGRTRTTHPTIPAPIKAATRDSQTIYKMHWPGWNKTYQPVTGQQESDNDTNKYKNDREKEKQERRKNIEETLLDQRDVQMVNIIPCREEKPHRAPWYAGAPTSQLRMPSGDFLYMKPPEVQKPKTEEKAWSDATEMSLSELQQFLKKVQNQSKTDVTIQVEQVLNKALLGCKNRHIPNQDDLPQTFNIEDISDYIEWITWDAYCTTQSTYIVKCSCVNSTCCTCEDQNCPGPPRCYRKGKENKPTHTTAIHAPSTSMSSLELSSMKSIRQKNNIPTTKERCINYTIPSSVASKLENTIAQSITQEDPTTIQPVRIRKIIQELENKNLTATCDQPLIRTTATTRNQKWVEELKTPTHVLRDPRTLAKNYCINKNVRLFKVLKPFMS